ncbi:hypothetical protein EON67_09335 [archaeon]|nr:MAG: hypothetical protein EON67_09335 [archaeon]
MRVCVCVRRRRTSAHTREMSIPQPWRDLLFDDEGVPTETSTSQGETEMSVLPWLIGITHPHLGPTVRCHARCALFAYVLKVTVVQ